MTDTDRIAQMAREAGFIDRAAFNHAEQLQAFARLVAEDCAKVCDERYDECYEPEAKEMAQAIRARYSKEG